MFEKRPVQLEIFSGQTQEINPKPEGRSFANKIWSYEKFILIAIGFLVVSVISFSLGIARGKRSSSLQLRGNSIAVNADKAKTTNTAPAVIVPANPVAPRIKPAQDILSGYTIQVASYRTKASAQAEAERLKKKGFKVSLITKGNYTMVCVGSFSTREEARVFIARLKKIYGDCLIRRL